MSLQHRQRLAQALLQLPDPGEPLDEAQKGMAVATCDAILRDICTQVQKAVKRRGAGFPIIKEDGHLDWWDPDGIRGQLAIAEEIEDTSMVNAMRKTLELLGNQDVAKAVLVGIADRRGLRIFCIPVDDPAQQLKQMLNSWEKGL